MYRTPLFSELILDLSLLVFELWAFDVFDLYRDFDLEKFTHFDFYFFKTRPG